MPNSGKYIKALHITTDRIGENLAGHVRWRETVARITLDVIGIVFNTAHLWNPVHADGDVATPFIINSLFSELRKRTHHLWLQRCGNALRIST